MLLNKLSDCNKRYFLNLAICLADADGVFSDIEKSLIDSQCKEMNIDNNEYKADMTLDAICDIIKDSMSNMEKKVTFIELTSLALVDEVLDEGELAFIERVRALLDIPQEVAQQAMDITTQIISYTKKLDHYLEW